MVIHERSPDVKGIGKWEPSTTRYIPQQGGSRSRLPLYDDKDYRRYPGFVGMDESLTETVFTVHSLYAHLGGAAVVPEGHGSIFIGLIRDETAKKLQEAEQAAQK